MLFRLFLFLFATGLILSSCKQATTPKIHFYHWKGSLKIDSLEKTILAKTQSKKLYLRFFDVDYQGEQGAVPIGVTVLDSSQAVFFEETIATIFITNRTMIQIPSDKIADLAEKITQKIFVMGKKFPLKGIQLDCDWSEKSQRNYFTLCSEIRKICKAKNIELSATIRLHQYKYASQTGIPPVDRGVLMLYNVGDIDGSNTQNSILDLSIVKSYLDKNTQYPLHLDIALPIFSWAVVQRMGKTVSLLNEVSMNELEASPHIKKMQKNLYKVTENHYFGGVYLYADDFLRWEETNITLLENLCKEVSSHIHIKELIFYHLDSKNLKNYEIETLTNLVHYWL